MKIALYIEDGVEQIVLTPQNDLEKALLGRINHADRITEILRGEFYACQGGWNRHGSGDSSTIIRLTPKPKGGEA